MSMLSAASCIHAKCPLRLVVLSICCIAILPSARVLLGQGLPINSLSSELSEILGRSGRKTVAVADFTDLQGCVTELGRYLAEDVSVALVNNAKGFEVIDRTNLRVLLQEHKLAATGIIDPATARRLGQVAGVGALITGTIAPLSDSVHISAKALDTESAKMLGGVTVDIPRTKTVEELLAKAVSNCNDSQTATVPPANAPSANPSQPIESASVDVGEFHFSIQACRHNGEKIECWGKVTNQGAQRSSLVIDDRNTSIVDNFGNVSRSGIYMNMSKVIVRVGNAQTWGPGGEVRAEMEPSLPLVFQLSAVSLDDTATSVSIILATREGKAVMRNISVRKH